MDLLKTALRAGAELNHISKQETTALMLASQEGHLSIVTYLLQQDAKIDVVLSTRLAPLASESTSPETLQIIHMEDFSDGEDDVGSVQEVEDIVTVCLSAAVSAAKSGWPDILKLLVHTHHADITKECGSIYGDENVLLSCAHHGNLRCLHVVLYCDGAEAMWAEALEHASFAPSLFDDSISPTSSDLWWIPSDVSLVLSSSSSSVSDVLSSSASASSVSSSSLSSSRTAELCHRNECRELLIDALQVQGRLAETIPFIRHTWNVLLEHADVDPETGQCVPNAKLIIAHHVLADILEQVGSAPFLLEAANLYGTVYQISKKLFGRNTEITITALGNWSCCLLRIKNERVPVDLGKEGEPMLRAALKDLKSACNVSLNDPRVIRWNQLLLPLQPGRAPFVPMSYLSAEETNPYYKSPPRNQHSTHRTAGDPGISYPSKEALHPAFSPFLDELEIVNNILNQLNTMAEERENEKLSTTVAAQEGSEREVLMEAVKKNWRCMLYAQVKWRKDYGVVMTAVSFHGVALQCCDVTLQDNEKICFAAVNNDWRSFTYASARMKRRKKLLKLAKQLLIEEMQSGTEKSESWRCLEFADPMLRGDVDVVNAAVELSEDAFQFVDRFVYAEGISWKKIWPAFLRRCRQRIVGTITTLLVLAAIAASAYFLVYVVFYSLIWPPVICPQTNITFVKQDDGAMLMYRTEYEVEYPNAHKCNASLFTPAPAPVADEIDNDDREKEREILQEKLEEENAKVAAEQKEKERRRLQHQLIIEN